MAFFIRRFNQGVNALGAKQLVQPRLPAIKLEADAVLARTAPSIQNACVLLDELGLAPEYEKCARPDAKSENETHRQSQIQLETEQPEKRRSRHS